MKHITTWLWFNGKTGEAVDFYMSIFKNAEITKKYYTPNPDDIPILVINFKLGDQYFGAFDDNLDYAKFSSATSLKVNCETKEELNELWDQLSENKRVDVPLKRHPFSELYGRCTDKFGVSWELNLNHKPQKVTPHLTFSDKDYLRAKEAIDFYTKIFPDATTTKLDLTDEMKLKWAELKINHSKIMFSDGHLDSEEGFSDAISFEYNCKDQKEIDRVWNSLIADGGEEVVCFWLHDKFGFSWQIIPSDFGEWAEGPNGDKVVAAMMKMTKPIIADLLKAREE